MTRPRNWTWALAFVLSGTVPLAVVSSGLLQTPWEIAGAGFASGWCFALAVWEIL